MVENRCIGNICTYYTWKWRNATCLAAAASQQTSVVQGCAPSKLLPQRLVWNRKEARLLLSARLQHSFKVFWLNVFIWKDSLRKAATWLSKATAVKSQQQEGLSTLQYQESSCTGLDCHSNWAGFEVKIRRKEKSVTLNTSSFIFLQNF